MSLYDIKKSLEILGLFEKSTNAMKVVSLSLHHQLKNIIPEFKAKFNTNMAILIWILVISFSIDCQIDIYQNTDQDLPNNILKRFNLFNAIYKDNFWGNNTIPIKPNHSSDKVMMFVTNNDILKQQALKLEIDEMVNNPEQMNLFFKHTFIVSAEDREITTEVLAKKVPCYYGNIQPKQFQEDKFKQFKKLLYPDSKENDKIETFNGSCVVFPAGITPYWSWDKDKEKLTKQGEIGIVFSNGVNFESKKTADYNNFNGKEKENELKDFIKDIALCLVTAAYKLTRDQNKKVCQLKIPAFGLGYFANYYCDKSQLPKMYLNAIYEALKNESTDMTWYVEFFDYKQLEFYKKAFDEIQKENNTNITLTYYSKTNLFDKTNSTVQITKMNQSDYLTVFCHAGDAHSFLGNGGYADNSLERVLIGYDNNHYLNAIHLLNLFLPEIMGARLPEIQLFEQVELMEVRLPEIQLFEHVELFEKENDDLNIGNNIFFSLLLMSGLTTIIIIAYQSKAIINLISNHFYFNQLLSFMQNK